ncbi:hypothetical protein [Promicromonospora soli]
MPGLAKLHKADCPHLVAERLAQVRPATGDELATFEVCTSCLIGKRTPFDSFESALEALPMPLENRSKAREVFRALTVTRTWVPASRQYIAVAPSAGDTAVAYFNRSFVDVRLDGGGYDRTYLLSGSRTSKTATTHGADQRQNDACETCGTQLPNTGLCDYCDG